MKIYIFAIWPLIFHKINCYIFSVIISIFNTGRYLDDSIGSLLNQTIGYKNIQIILVNDGSTDESEKICIKYKEKYENIIYIYTSHKGVSNARNIGLSYAKASYINFLDSDDKWEPTAFRNVYLFYKFHKNIDLVGGRMKYFESKNNYHYLDYKFKITRVVNLNKNYDCIQLSSSSSFFRYSSIKGKKFDEGIFSGEDVRFISNLLLINPIIALIKEAIYYYRKRSDSSSAMQNTEKKKNFYFSTINLVQQYLINSSYELYNKILPFIQFYIAYEILFRISSLSFKFLDNKSYKEYCSIIENLLNQIEDKYILEQKIFSSKLQIFVLSKKYNRDLRYEIYLRNNQFIYSNYVLMNLKYYNEIIIWISLDIKENILHLQGQDRFWLPRDKFYYFCKLGNKIFYPKYSYSGFDFITLFGNINKGRIVSFDIALDIIDNENLSFYISYMGKELEILTSFNLKSHISSLKKSYYIKEKYIVENNHYNLYIYKYDKNLAKYFELEYCRELKAHHKEYLIEFRQKNIEYRKKNKIEERKNIWLINDRKDRAGDNGEYFFRYLKKIKPKDILFYFVIEKNCPDYERLKSYKNIIDLNSRKYLNIFLKSDKIISSISDSWVSNAFGKDAKYMIDLYHFDYIYLQNGIVKDDLSRFLNKVNKKFDLIITSSKKEFKSFLDDKYGYNRNNLALTGLPRFDNLLEIHKQIKREKIIIIFPTWRLYIKGTRDLITLKPIESENFINTKYFNFYNNLINNQSLLSIMQQNDYEGIFCLHPNFAAQYKHFSENNIFKIKEQCNEQELFAKASLLVTDYSTIFFDFGYIQKPVIYTHFDYDEYRNNQFSEGYFDYKKDGFGKICYDIQCTIREIISEIKNNCVLNSVYEKRIKRFFQYYDDNNCHRVFLEIINEKNRVKVHQYSIKRNIFIFFTFLIIKILIQKLKKYYIEHLILSEILN